jgi:hypothetical protein
MENIMKIMVIAMVMCCADAWADQNVGFLKSVSGDVQIKRGESFVAAHPGVQLMNTDLLVSGGKGYAGIIFTDGTTLTIGPDTEFNINNYIFEPDNNIYDFSMYLKKGSAVYNSGKIGKLSPGSVKLSTPRATVGVRGTRFIIKVE